MATIDRKGGPNTMGNHFDDEDIVREDDQTRSREMDRDEGDVKNDQGRSEDARNRQERVNR